MGGLERFRLKEGKALIRANVAAGDRGFPVEIVVGGPGNWRLDYVDDKVGYVYTKGNCRKTVYGVVARCTPAEEAWMDATRILQGLIFPVADASSLGSAFVLRDETAVGGKQCDVVEIRPETSNLRLRAAYDRESSLIAQASFSVELPPGQESDWLVRFGDWGEVDGIKVPFTRTVYRDGAVVWRETADLVAFDMYDKRAFDPPVPPTTDQPLSAYLPARRVIETELEGQMFEVPAPFTTVGGGPVLVGEAKTLEPVDMIGIVVKDTVVRVAAARESITREVKESGQETVGEPHMVLFEQPASPEDSVLVMVYVPIRKKDSEPETP